LRGAENSLPPHADNNTASAMARKGLLMSASDFLFPTV
jgi:hypothetical protein